MFDTETIYTFEFYQNLFDANTYSLDLGFSKIGCSKVLDGQPIQWLGKMRDGRYLWVSVLLFGNVCMLVDCGHVSHFLEANARTMFDSLQSFQVWHEKLLTGQNSEK